MTAKKNAPQPYFFNPCPVPGDIVLCFFPEGLSARNAGKHRPAIVMAVSTEKKEVEVVYGTSQKLDRIYPTEVLFLSSDPSFPRTGLRKSTKFDLSRKVKLPFNSQWFCPPEFPPGQTSPILGVVPPTSMAQLKKAYDASLNKPKS